MNLGLAALSLVAFGAGVAHAAPVNAVDAAYTDSKTVGEYIDKLKGIAPKAYVNLLEKKAIDMLSEPLAEIEQRSPGKFVVHTGKMMIPVEYFERKKGEDYKLKVNHKLIVLENPDDFLASLDKIEAAFPKTSVSRGPAILELLFPFAKASFWSEVKKGASGTWDAMKGSLAVDKRRVQDALGVNCTEIKEAFTMCRDIAKNGAGNSESEKHQKVLGVQAVNDKYAKDYDDKLPKNCPIDADTMNKYGITGTDREHGYAHNLSKCVTFPKFRQVAQQVNSSNLVDERNPSGVNKSHNSGNTRIDYGRSGGSSVNTGRPSR